MRLHSTLDGRAGEFRIRGAAWERDGPAFRGFLYLIPRGEAHGRHRVVEADGESLWNLLDALSEQVAALSGAAVARLNARAVVDAKPAPRRSPAGHEPARQGSGTD